jgi:hypothetical protein
VDLSISVSHASVALVLLSYYRSQFDLALHLLSPIKVNFVRYIILYCYLYLQKYSIKKKLVYVVQTIICHPSTKPLIAEKACRLKTKPYFLHKNVYFNAKENIKIKLFSTCTIKILHTVIIKITFLQWVEIKLCKGPINRKYIYVHCSSMSVSSKLLNYY